MDNSFAVVRLCAWLCGFCGRSAWRSAWRSCQAAGIGWFFGFGRCSEAYDGVLDAQQAVCSRLDETAASIRSVEGCGTAVCSRLDVSAAYLQPVGRPERTVCSRLCRRDANIRSSAVRWRIIWRAIRGNLEDDLKGAAWGNLEDDTSGRSPLFLALLARGERDGSCAVYRLWHNCQGNFGHCPRSLNLKTGE